MLVFMASNKKFQEQLIQMLTHRGFVWGPEPEIYGGLAGFFTYAPLGKRLKNNIENKIREVFIANNYWEVECPIVMPREVWKASGHLEGFTDPLVECSKCKGVFRIDKLIEEKYPDVIVSAFKEHQFLDYINDLRVKCPTCGSKFLPEIRRHNLMMRTTIGANVEAYNRPETATTTYLPFKRYYEFFRKKFPFGVFQIGKAFRNEISPRQHVLRCREFTQAEAQLFLTKKLKQEWKPYENAKKEKLPLWTWYMQDNKKGPQMVSLDNAMSGNLLKNKAYAWTLYISYKIFTELGIPQEKIRFRQHAPDEKAFYSDDTWDLEVELQSFGWTEMCGISDRTDYDVGNHSKASGTDMTVPDEENVKIFPQIIEIAFGTDRPAFAILDMFYKPDAGVGERNVLALPKHLAPIQVAVFPLMARDNLDTKAREVYEMLQKDFMAFYDEAGSIGKRYARMDEVGTPFCVTIDYETLEKSIPDVTIRERDTGKQERVKITELAARLKGSI